MENSETDFQHICVTVNENDLETGALKILQVIRPKWPVAGIKFKLLTDGITNKLIGCLYDGAPESETVLIRVYGAKTDLLIDRRAETRNILTLSKIGQAPNLYATFENGLAYRYQPGCTLNAETVRKPEIYSLVARRMARLHKVKPEDTENARPFIWKKCRDFLNLVPEEFSCPKKQSRFEELGLPNQSDLNDEIIHLQKTLEKTECPVVFAHNDLLLGNVVYTESEDSVTFIDYEYAAFNYQAYDIANHFAEFVGLNMETIDYKTMFPSEELQKDWIKIYLEEFQTRIPSDSEIDDLYLKVNKFVLVSHIFWGIWALIQAEHSNISFDYMMYAKIRLSEYFGRKSELLNLKSSM